MSAGGLLSQSFDELMVDITPAISGRGFILEFRNLTSKRDDFELKLAALVLQLLVPRPRRRASSLALPTVVKNLCRVSLVISFK